MTTKIKKTVLESVKKLPVIAFVFVTSLTTNAQDLITKRNGDEIKAKVIEVGTDEVKFKKFDNIDGPLFVVAKSEIIFIKYENGSKEVFEEIKTSVLNMQVAPQINWKTQAEDDAVRHYRGYRGAQAGTFWTCLLLGPLVGLIPAIATSSTRPSKQKYLQYPNAEYFNNLEYKEAYINRAHKRKKHKVWGMYGLGSGLFVGAVLLLSAGG